MGPWGPGARVEPEKVLPEPGAWCHGPDGLPCCDGPDECQCSCSWCDCRYAERMGS